MNDSVVALLHLALSLLIAAQQPNVPEELRFRAINTANFAISYAQSELHTPVVAIAKPDPIVAEPEPSSWIKLTAGGKDSPITATPNSQCHNTFKNTVEKCWRTDVSWATSGIWKRGCGFKDIEKSSINGSGNKGDKGTLEGQFLLGRTILRLECSTDAGPIFKDLEVNVI